MMNVPKNSQPLQRRELRFWLGCVVLFVGLSVLFYYGYCWGLWGRQSLLLQYFFQCKCPAISQEARYPRPVDVILSACSQPYVKVSPSGRLLYVREETSEPPIIYLLDLQTMQKIDGAGQPISSFLTDDLWFLKSGLDNYIIDSRTGLQVPIHRFVDSRPDAKVNGQTNLALLAESLHHTEHVFLVGASSDTVVALAADFATYPENNFTTTKFDIPDFDMAHFLQQNNIRYQLVPPDFPHEVRSPNGKWIARDDGIYLADTNQLIVKAPPALVRGWTNEGKAAIYSSNGRCLLRRGLPLSDDIGCAITVPQPVLKLWVPEEYR